MAEDGRIPAKWAPPWKEAQRYHPGSLRSFVSGSQIKRITALPRPSLPSFDLTGRAFSLPANTVSDEKKNTSWTGGCEPTPHGFWPIKSTYRQQPLTEPEFSDVARRQNETVAA